MRWGWRRRRHTKHVLKLFYALLRPSGSLQIYSGTPSRSVYGVMATRRPANLDQIWSADAWKSLQKRTWEQCRRRFGVVLERLSRGDCRVEQLARRFRVLLRRLLRHRLLRLCLSWSLVCSVAASASDHRCVHARVEWREIQVRTSGARRFKQAP